MFTQIILLVIIGVLFIWAIVERVCKCVENCKTADAYIARISNVNSSFGELHPDDISDLKKKIQEAGKNE